MKLLEQYFYIEDPLLILILKFIYISFLSQFELEIHQDFIHGVGVLSENNIMLS